MTDESVIWNKDAEKKLQDNNTFPYQEAHSDIEDIQNGMLNLISELEVLKMELSKQELSDRKSQKVLEFIEKTRQEIIKLEG